jgi:hypothetical protein
MSTQVFPIKWLYGMPLGFVRIRHYGFLANRVCREKLELCRALLLGAMTPPGPVEDEPASEAKGTLA